MKKIPQNLNYSAIIQELGQIDEQISVCMSNILIEDTKIFEFTQKKEKLLRFLKQKQQNLSQIPQ